MSRNRFATGESVRIPLSDDDWIEVKKDLDTGDQKLLENAGVMPPIRLADGSVTSPIDWSRFEIEKVAIFLTDWSFKGADGKVRPLKNADGVVSLQNIRALESETFDEVNAAILRHAVGRSAEKNALKLAKKLSTKKAEESPALTEGTSDTPSGA